MKKVILTFLIAALTQASWASLCPPWKPIVNELLRNVALMREIKEAQYIFVTSTRTTQISSGTRYKIERVYKGDVPVQSFWSGPPSLPNPWFKTSGPPSECFKDIWFVGNWDDYSIKPWRVCVSWCWWELKANWITYYYIAKFVPTTILAGTLIYIIGTPGAWIAILAVVFIFIRIRSKKKKRKKI